MHNGVHAMQTFKVDPAVVDHVRFEVQSNYGNKEWTCVYRLRVHGKGRDRQMLLAASPT